MVTLLFNVLPAPAAHLVPVIARDVLHVGVGLMGLLQSTAGLGSLTVVLLIASAANVSHHGRLYMGGVMVALLALLLFSFSRWYALSIPALLVYGLGMGVFTTMQPTLVMLLARADMRGKALGVITLAIGVGPVGALFIGGVAESAGPSFAIGLNAAIGLVCLVFIAALLPSLWRRAWTAAE